VTDIESFLRYLGSRYERARDDLDEVRVRAMELVVAACMTELHRNPPVFIPEPVREVVGVRQSLDPDETSELDVESYLKEIDDWEEDPLPSRRSAQPSRPEVPPPPPPQPAREPIRKPEPTADVDGPASAAPETEPEPLTEATNWSQTPLVDDDRPPEEPVRGAWEAPRD
jgi:hypothetical protein